MTKTPILALLSIVLTLSPGLALAGGCHTDAKEETAASCAAGTVWDAVKGGCVTVSS